MEGRIALGEGLISCRWQGPFASVLAGGDAEHLAETLAKVARSLEAHHESHSGGLMTRVLRKGGPHTSSPTEACTSMVYALFSLLQLQLLQPLDYQ